MTRISFEDHSVALRPNESVLDGLLRIGLSVRFSCRAGSCQTCLMRALSGSPPRESQQGLPTHLQQLGYFLPCKCRPDDDLLISSPDPDHLKRQALVAEKAMLGPDLCLIHLEASPDFKPVAGQCIRVVHPDGDVRPYSVASRPGKDYFFELHIRRVPGGKLSTWLVDEVMVGDVIDTQPPAGSFVNRNPAPGQKLLLAATGTGLAAVLPILHDTLSRDSKASIWLFHGARDRSGLYADGLLRGLSVQTPGFHYHGCCSRSGADGPILPGRITRWVSEKLPDLSGFRIFAAGHPSMVADLCLLAQAQGLDSKTDIITDAFEFEHVRLAHSKKKARSDSSERHVPSPDPELWEQLGNGSILRDVLRDFYQLAFNDQQLGPYFAGVTRQRLQEKQYSFLRSLMLGTRDYFGQRPRNAHHWMVISDELFDYRLKLMESVMVSHGVGLSWIQRWHVFEEFFRADIVKQRPIDRIMDGQLVRQDGMDDAILDEGSLCDGCGQVLNVGSPVRFHRRLGTLYCGFCAGGIPAATGNGGSTEPVPSFGQQNDES